MFTQELEAQNNLHTISQKTNYLVEWSEHKPINKYLQELRKDVILQESDEQHNLMSSSKKQKGINRELTEKFNLKRYEKKLDTINQICYPMSDKNLFKSEENFKSNEKQSPSPSLYKRKVASNGRVHRVVQAQFLKRKLQLFERKHRESQKELNARLIMNGKLKYTPKSLKEKRSQHSQKKGKVLVNQQELQAIKRMVFKNSKRFSVPNLTKIEKKSSINRVLDQFFL